MADWPIIGGGGFAKCLNFDAATSNVDVITVGASHTKSAWVEVAETAEDYCGLNILIIRATANPGNNSMVDIGIGASGSQQIILNNYLISCQYVNGATLFLPIKIPSGTKIWVRGQSNEASGADLYVGVVGMSGDFLYSSYQVCTAYGATEGTTKGVVMSVDETVDTKGSYTEITAATERDIKHLIINGAWPYITTTANREHLIDIAVGSEGNEIDIISNLFFWSWAGDVAWPSHYEIPIFIPAGSRLSGRAQQSYTDSGYAIELILHGLS